MDVSSFFQPDPSSSNETSKSSKELIKKSYRPLTIKQVKMAEHREQSDTVCYIDNEEITDVTIIGVVRSITKQDASIGYTLEDGTGAIDALYWTKDMNRVDVMSEDEENIVLESYARVSGRISIFNNGKGRNISAFKVSTIEDFNEITYHLLDAVYTHLSSGKVDALSIMSAIKKGANESKNKEAIVSKAIIECSNTIAGAYIPAVIVHLREHLPEQEIMQVVENLEIRGELYHTSDAQHVRLSNQP